MGMQSNMSMEDARFLYLRVFPIMFVLGPGKPCTSTFPPTRYAGGRGYAHVQP